MINNKERVDILGVMVDPLSIDEAANRVIEGCFQEGFKYVVTPNSDHLISFNKSEVFKRAYEKSWLTVADGWPLVLISRLIRKPLPERVAGSDLVPRVLDLANKKGVDFKVYVLGGMGQVPKLASDYIKREFPNIDVVGFDSPPLGFERDKAYCNGVISEINRLSPDFIIIGLGSPKQELFVHSICDRLNRGVAVCAGATVDFMAGSISRCPGIYSRFGMEWLYRLCLEPRRLWRRYLNVILFIPAIFFGRIILGKR